MSGDSGVTWNDDLQRRRNRDLQNAAHDDMRGRGAAARVYRRGDGSMGVFSTTGAPLGILVDEFSPEAALPVKRKPLAIAGAVGAIAIFVLLAVLAIWHHGRWYERQYGADIHASRFSY